MKFSTREDIEAPIAAVFEALTDFEGFERSAIRRGAEVRRMSDPARPGALPAWDARIPFRGRQRDLRVLVDAWEPVTLFALSGEGSGYAARLEVELMALSPRRTRIAVRLKVKPQSLPARMMMQSAKLARGKLTRRYKERVADFAKAAEARLNRGA